MGWKSAMSTRYTVVFTTSSRPSPAPRSTAVRFFSTCSVCFAVSPSTRAPLPGSRAICPEVNSMRLPPCRRTTCPCAYGPIAAGASGTWTDVLIAPSGSFHRHALRQVARLVHVASAQHRHVVGEQLERDHRQQRLEQGRGLGSGDHG